MHKLEHDPILPCVNTIPYAVASISVREHRLCMRLFFLMTFLGSNRILVDSSQWCKLALGERTHHNNTKAQLTESMHSLLFVFSF